jgi:hypothetical protein
MVIASALLSWPAGVSALEEPSPVGLDGEVRVIERGEQPWRLLRYRWVPGSTETARTDMRMSMRIVEDGEETSMTMPVSLSFGSTVTQVWPDGSARLELLYTGYDIGVSQMTVDGEPLDDRVLESIGTELQARSRQLVGSTGWEVYDARGVLLDWGIDMPEAFPQDLQAQVEQMSAAPTVLPSEPVGVGAIWEGGGTFSESGLEVGMVVVNELRASEGDALVLDTSIELDASGGSPREIGWDVDGSIDELMIRGGGSVNVDLGRVIAQDRLDVEFHLELSPADDGSGTSAMIFDVDMTMETTPG